MIEKGCSATTFFNSTTLLRRRLRCCQTIRDSKSATLISLIKGYVKEGCRIYTDEYIGYHLLKDSEDYSHFSVNHKMKEFVTGEKNHTNTIEGFWGQLKRMILGVCHFISAKYLQRYVVEAMFRYNTMAQKEVDRFQLMFSRSIGVFSYHDERFAA